MSAHYSECKYYIKWYPYQVIGMLQPKNIYLWHERTALQAPPVTLHVRKTVQLSQVSAWWC